MATDLVKAEDTEIYFVNDEWFHNEFAEEAEAVAKMTAKEVKRRFNERRGSGGGSSKEKQRNSTDDNSSDVSEREICRNFLSQKCVRGFKCKYSHPTMQLCRDFQSSGCTRSMCNFLHMNVDEEDSYKRTGFIPMHAKDVSRKSTSAQHSGLLGKRKSDTVSDLIDSNKKYLTSDSSSPQTSFSNISCRDFEQGQCMWKSKWKSICKYHHYKLNICRDFQKDKCDRAICRFLHMSYDEEAAYTESGVVPKDISAEEVKRHRIPMETQQQQQLQSTSRPTQSNSRPTQSNSRPTQSNSRATLDQSSKDAYSSTGDAVASHMVLAQENVALRTRVGELKNQVADLCRMSKGDAVASHTVLTQENVALRTRVGELNNQVADLRRMINTLCDQRMHCQKFHKW